MATTLRSLLNVNFNNDGSWNYTWSFISVIAGSITPLNMSGVSYYITSSTAGGYWASNPAPGVGNNYEVNFAGSDVTNTITETNTGTSRVRRSLNYAIYGANGGWSSLSSNRVCQLDTIHDETPYYTPSSITAPTWLTTVAAMSLTPTVRTAGGGGAQASGTCGPLQCQLRWNIPGPDGTPPGGGGGGCVHFGSYVRYNQQANQVVPGDWIRGMAAPEQFHYFKVVSNRAEEQDCVRITMRTGASLIVSKTTPLTLKDNRLILVSDLELGTELPVFYESDELYPLPFWDQVSEIEEMGMLLVCLINIGGHSYAAGEKRGAYIYTHNMAQQKN